MCAASFPKALQRPPWDPEWPPVFCPCGHSALVECGPWAGDWISLSLGVPTCQMGIRITATQGCGEAVNVLILTNIRQGQAPSCRSAAENSKLCLEAEPAAAFSALGSPCLLGTGGARVSLLLGHHVPGRVSDAQNQLCGCWLPTHQCLQGPGFTRAGAPLTRPCSTVFWLQDSADLSPSLGVSSPPPRMPVSSLSGPPLCAWWRGQGFLMPAPYFLESEHPG